MGYKNKSTKSSSPNLVHNPEPSTPRGFRRKAKRDAEKAKAGGTAPATASPETATKA